MDKSKPILYVEDDQVDAMIMRKVFKTLAIPNRLIRKFDGLEAVEYLMSEGSERPGMIILDTNMPRMDGSEFLRVISEDADLNKIPVIVIVGPNSVTEVKGPNVVGCVEKSIKFDDFAAAMNGQFQKLYPR